LGHQSPGFFGLVIVKAATKFQRKPMKKIFFMLLMSGSLTLAAQPATTDLNWTPTANFVKTEHDFGKIPEGPKVSTEFEFKNTGKEPIYVTNATAGCGCTTPEFDKAPIAPGKKGKIKVGFNSENRPGNFSKDVTVTFVSGVNRDKTGSTKVTIKGSVTPKAAAK
jgi:hypothetical protein